MCKNSSLQKKKLTAKKQMLLREKCGVEMRVKELCVHVGVKHPARRASGLVSLDLRTRNPEVGVVILCSDPRGHFPLGGRFFL